ncbi:MAG: phytanoyl-CoA dioxygenase family protein [Planctomycetota bacterium]|nr:phytanoyl-CoA dioxygenase family protein [Planctomycetota bacterium]MDA1140654.1 phytanoyl-CoA dioxygenase family protein [Planctomycetota bacterium]
MNTQRLALTETQLSRYRERGYVFPLAAFEESEIAEFLPQYNRMQGLLPGHADVSRVNWWHKRNNYIYGLATNPGILDYVESILGPNIILWGSHFFVKDPRDNSVVPWHQDAQYWPLTPMNATTIYIAFTDCDSENSCMKVIPGSHRGKTIRPHRRADKEEYDLKDEIPESEFDPSEAVGIELKAGEVSLHDDALIHGSGPNHSDRLRVGLTFRYSSTDVKCDLSIWPTYRAYLVRGVDEYRNNPPGVIPTEFGAPDKIFPE